MTIEQLKEQEYILNEQLCENRRKQREFNAENYSLKTGIRIGDKVKSKLNNKMWIVSSYYFVGTSCCGFNGNEILKSGYESIIERRIYADVIKLTE